MHQRVTAKLRQSARSLLEAMDHTTRLKIFEAVGINEPNRGDLAIDYLCDPVHLSQFHIAINGNQTHVSWARMVGA